jgi:hypothetical protein
MMTIMMVSGAMILGALIGYEIGNIKGFTDGYEVGKKTSQNFSME